jgi:hypothetical protein
LTGCWDDFRSWPLIFVLMWQFVNTWNPGYAYVDLGPLTGQVVQNESGAIALVQCPGESGSGMAHSIHEGEALTCEVCGTFMCQGHTYVQNGQRVCGLCYVMDGRR